MSKLYERYKEEKKKNDKFLYLFKCGAFYIFIDDDAKSISSITTLKLTKLSNNIVKCGFPIGALSKYMSIFSNLSIDVVVLKNNEFNINEFLDKIEMDSITPLEALNKLKEVKDNYE